MNVQALVDRLGPQLDAVAKRRRCGSRDAAAATLLLEALEREDADADTRQRIAAERAELERCKPR